MPTYVYKCSKCDYEFEEFQSITAEPLDKCPKCKEKVNRVIQAGAGFIFKGSGFYQTDYRSGEYKKAASKDNKSNGNNKEQKIEKKSKSKPKQNSKKTDKAKS